MLDNCTYNKIKLMHELSTLIWFIQKHAIADANTAQDSKCLEMLNELSKDLQTHLEALQKDGCHLKS